MLVRHRRQQKCLFLAPNEPTGPASEKFKSRKCVPSGWKHCADEALLPKRDARVLLGRNMHPQLPLCPNCSRPMIVARTIPGVLYEPEVNVYECSRCIDFITEDHLTIGDLE
jgi:hypothetical protein